MAAILIRSHYIFLLGKKKPAEVKPVGDGTYDCTYYPEKEGPCKVEVKYADKQIPGR